MTNVIHSTRSHQYHKYPNRRRRRRRRRRRAQFWFISHHYNGNCHDGNNKINLQLNFSNLNKSPNNKTNINEEVFNIVYKDNVINEIDTLLNPISPALAIEQGNICLIYIGKSINKLCKIYQLFDQIYH